MDIVEQIRSDRETGARRLESEYKAGLLTLASRLCVDPSDAEELVNRTFAEVIRSIDRYAEQSAFFGWMARIMVNLHGHDMDRKSATSVVSDQTALELAQAPEADALVFREVDASLLRDAIEDLPDDMRKTVVSHYFLGLSVNEVARLLSTPSGTVKWRLQAARRILSAKLGAAAKKPGVKAVLVALALCGLTALGAVVYNLANNGEAQNVGGAASGRAAAAAQTGATGEGTGATDAGPAGPAGPSVSSVPSVNDLSTSSTQGEQNMNATTTSRAAAMFAAATVATTAAIPFPASAYVNTAERAVIPPNEIMTVEVAADTVWDKPVFVDGILRKTGAGKLTIVGEKLYGHGKVEVAEGELAVTATGSGSVAIEAPDVLADAAIWLDASRHVAGTDGAAATGDAAKWFDVREEEWATPGFTTNYIYAEGMTNLADDGAWPTIGADDASRPYVYFGGYGSGQYMLWRKPAGDKAKIDVWQSFAAYNPDGSHGHYIGVDDKTLGYFSVNVGSAQTWLFGKDSESDYNHLRTGRVFLNGERVSVSDSIDLHAVQTVETDSYPSGKPADAFFNYRSYQNKAGSGPSGAGNRVGGGRMHEFVAFTNRIAETDRVLVAHWLLRKWVNTSGYGAFPAFDVSQDATLTLPGVIAGTAKVSSRGTFRSSGAATLGSDALADPFAGLGGAAAFDEGAVTTNLAGAAVAAVPGKIYDADAYSALTVSAGTAGEVRKTGPGALALAGIGDATSLSVTAGTASLRAVPSVPDAAPPQNCLADSGFEEIYAQTALATYADGASAGAWTVTNYGPSAATRIVYKTGWGKNMWGGGALDLGTVEGNYFLLLKQGGGVRQDVDLPRSGRYEVTLRASQRLNFPGFARIYLDGFLVGTAQSPDSQKDWDFIRFETPWIAAGPHVFTISSEVTVDTAIGLDDIQLRWLDNVRAVAIPNANFEDADWVGGVTQPATRDGIMNAINASNVLSSAFLTKWTASGTVELLRGLPYLRSKADFDAPDTGTGCVSAYLHKGASIRQTVTVPEDGLYELGVLACAHVRKGVPRDNTFANRGASLRLSLGGASETLSLDNWSPKRVGLSSAVRLSAGDAVAIEIAAESVSYDYNYVLVDDVRLEKLSNLVANPGFEDGATGSLKEPVGWTVAANPESKGIVHAVDDNNGAKYFGTSYAEGTHRARMHSGTVLSQVIPLKPGLHRLSFWDVTRVHDNGVNFAYGPSPIRVTLSKGAVTNLCETVTPYQYAKEATRREFLVRVREAGDWTLSFEATATGDKSSFLDAVGLVREDSLAADAVPETGSKPSVFVAAGARLGLDWPGLLEADSVKCGGQSLVDDIVAEDAPDFLYGIGSLNAKPKGTIVIFR